jgi:integrase/recombinase XerD
MSSSEMSVLSVTELAPIIRELERRAVKDKSYQQSPVGREVMRYLRALRWQESSPHTLDSYESVLAKLAIRHADFASLETFASPVGTDYLREFLDLHWGDLSPATRRQRLAVLRSFFSWAMIEQKIGYDPTRAIKPPKEGGRIRQAHTEKVIRQLVQGQESLRDEVLLLLMARRALRKNDVRMLRARDCDLPRDLIALRHVKGGGEVLIPIEDAEISRLLYLVIVGERRDPDEYLLYPKNDPFRPMDSSNVHRWFKACLERAGLPDFEMHELRHTAADDLWRRTGNLVLAQQLLRHKSIETTRRYLHPSEHDLRSGLRLVAAARDKRN